MITFYIALFSTGSHSFNLDTISGPETAGCKTPKTVSTVAVMKSSDNNYFIVILASSSKSNCHLSHYLLVMLSQSVCRIFPRMSSSKATASSVASSVLIASSSQRLAYFLSHRPSCCLLCCRARRHLSTAGSTMPATQSLLSASMSFTYYTFYYAEHLPTKLIKMTNTLHFYLLCTTITQQLLPRWMFAFWKKSDRAVSEGRMSANRRIQRTTRGVFRDFRSPLPTASPAIVFCSRSTTTHLKQTVSSIRYTQS